MKLCSKYSSLYVGMLIAIHDTSKLRQGRQTTCRTNAALSAWASRGKNCSKKAAGASICGEDWGDKLFSTLLFSFVYLLSSSPPRSLEVGALKSARGSGGAP